MTRRGPAPRLQRQMELGCELRNCHRGPRGAGPGTTPHSLMNQDSRAEAEICSRRPPGGVTRRGLAFRRHFFMRSGVGLETPELPGTGRGYGKEGRGGWGGGEGKCLC